MSDGTMLKIEGLAYYAKVKEPGPDYNESQNAGSGRFQYEVNLALDEEGLALIKAKGVNVGLKEPGGRPYTDKPVVLIKRWATDYNGNPNQAPFAKDADREDFFDPDKDDEYIPNGSRVAVFWHPYTYSKGKYTTAWFDGIQVLELANTSEANPTINEDEIPF
jgi:hypothetical protein